MCVGVGGDEMWRGKQDEVSSPVGESRGGWEDEGACTNLHVLLRGTIIRAGIILLVGVAKANSDGCLYVQNVRELVPPNRAGAQGLVIRIDREGAHLIEEAVERRTARA